MTFATFNSTDVGSRRLYAAPTKYGMSDWGGDQSVYNRQYYGMDIVFDKALNVVIDSGDNLIAVSTGNRNTTWSISGGRYSYENSDQKRDFDDFWNIRDKTREPGYRYDYFNDRSIKPLNIRFIYPSDDLMGALKGAESFTYIYMPTINEGFEDIVRDNFNVIDEGTFTSHGFKLSYIRGNGH